MRKFKYIKNLKFPIEEWGTIDGIINGSFELSRRVNSKILDEISLKINGELISCGDCYLINNNENLPFFHKEYEDRRKEYNIINFLNRIFHKTNNRKEITYQIICI